jgi:hypothetical protein
MPSKALRINWTIKPGTAHASRDLDSPRQTLSVVPAAAMRARSMGMIVRLPEWGYQAHESKP